MPLDENTLQQLYQTQCDQLFKSMNLELFFHIHTLACNTQNEFTLQICATLISNYINLNHQEISQFEMIFDEVFTIIKNTNSNCGGTYHLLGSILANIHFYFQDKLPPNKFNQYIQDLLINKTIAVFPIIEATIRKLNPNHKLHKKAIITIDSQHRAVKNNFYKNSLELLLDTIMYILMKNLTQFTNQAISLFDDILEGEFQTDTKEKDFHKLRRGDIKNDNSLQKQLSKFTLKLIEEEIQQKMIENSTLQWVDPTRSNIKKLWSRIMNVQFIQQLIILLPTQSNLLKVLANICKVLKKHYCQDPQAIEIVYFMTTEIQKMPATNFGIIQLLKFSNRTLFANSSIEWITFNLQLFGRVQNIEELVQVFRFLRQLCRYYRQQKNINLDEISVYFMQIISNFFIHWISTDSQIFQKENYHFQNIRYNIKVIACFISKNYFDYFKSFVAQNEANFKLVNEAFNFLLLGFKSLAYQTSYQLDVAMKYRHYQNMELFLYPFDMNTFSQFNYQQFLAEQIEILWRINFYLQSNGIQNNRFYYYIWKVLFDKDLLIKFEPILQLSKVDRLSLFNFSCIVKSKDSEFKGKCLNLIHNSKFRFEKDPNFNTYNCFINNIYIPADCFLEFTQVNTNMNAESTEILKAYNGIKCNLYNSQNDAYYNQEESDNLLQQFQQELNLLIGNAQDIHQIMQIYNSLLNENGRFTYKQVMTMMWEQERFKQFTQLLMVCQNTDIPLQLLAFTKLMINAEAVKYLRSEIVDEIYDWIYNITKFHVDWLKINTENYKQERQLLGETTRTQTYKLYYRPIRKLMKLFVKIKHMGKCLTSKAKVRVQIQGLIFETLHLINLNDLNSLIHKMEPLYRICEWLAESEYLQKVSSKDSHLILEFVDQGIKLQEKLTFTISIKIFENIKDKPSIQEKHYVLIQFILEDLLIAAYIYNQKVQDIGKLMYNHLRKYPNLFDSLFVSIQQRVLLLKSTMWQQQFVQKATLLKQKLNEKQDLFIEAFVQLQMLYNYLQ